MNGIRPTKRFAAHLYATARDIDFDDLDDADLDGIAAVEAELEAHGIRSLLDYLTVANHWDDDTRSRMISSHLMHCGLSAELAAWFANDSTVTDS